MIGIGTVADHDDHAACLRPGTPIRQHAPMPIPPESTKISLGQRLRERARERWPALATVDVRHRGGFAYVTGELADGTALPLCRLRYGGYANQWGFAIYLASKDGYQDSILPSGYPVGTAEEALDCACGLYLGDPTAWHTDQPPTNFRPGPLRWFFNRL
jgi:hypothetical protein